MTLRSRAPVVVSFAALLLASDASLARAETPMMKLARRLEPPVGAPRVHPLADANGNIPFVVELDPGEDPAALGLHWVAPGRAAGSLNPQQLFWFADDHPDLRISVAPEIRPQLNVGPERSGVKVWREQLDPAGLGEGVIVGVVDTGIDISHPAFLDEDGNTRIAWLLTWGFPLGKHPELEEEFGCTNFETQCAIYSAEDIDEILASSFVRDDLKDGLGHGTHVSSIAAGNGGRDGLPFNIGMAPKATLIVAAPSERGGFADSVVLLGTKFIFDRADAMGMPAVVNLSLGGDFGPHDGTSTLEDGTASFVGDDKPGRAIVTSAGNSGTVFEFEGEPLGIHTEVHVEPHAPADVPLYVPTSTGGDIYLWITFRPGDEVSVGLDGPSGAPWIGLVEPGDEAGYTTDDVEAAIINNLVNDNSSLNEETNGVVVGIHGDWGEKDANFNLRFEGSGDAQMWVVGQGDAIEGAYFVNATTQGTVNQPASHPRLLAVGCTVNKDRWPAIGLGTIAIEEFGGGPISVDGACYFSAGGPTPLGVLKPEILAPGAFVTGAMSVGADPRTTDSNMFDNAGCPDGSQCYVVDDYYAVASGTSMSSPFVAGAIALLFEQNPNLTQAQATELIQASARKPEGELALRSQVGAGALDLSHALELLGEQADLGPPDPAGSFWFLGAESARPDPSWPVTGTLQLRRADGSIATGLDGSLIKVQVEGGSLVKSPTKVEGGYFQFIVAGRPGTGGQTMTVRVLYDGERIGEEVVLPIGIDQWAADGEPKAAGGLACSVTGFAGNQSNRAGWLALALALALALRRSPPSRSEGGRGGEIHFNPPPPGPSQNPMPGRPFELKRISASRSPVARRSRSSERR